MTLVVVRRRAQADVEDAADRHPAVAPDVATADDQAAATAPARLSRTGPPGGKAGRAEQIRLIADSGKKSGKTTPIA